MKPILAIATPFPEQLNIITGGVEGVAYHLTEGLDKSGQYEIHIIAPCSDRNSGVDIQGNITVHWLKISRLPGFLDYWSLYRRQLHHCLGEINPDITHFQGVAGWTIGYEKPYVLTIHGLYEKDVLYTVGRLKWLRAKIISIVEKIGRSRSKNIISISPYVRQEIGVQIQGDIRDIENPVGDSFFQIKRNISFGKILYIGRISPLKNILGLIRAFYKVYQRESRAALYLAGQSVSKEYESSCRKLIDELELKENIIFLGNLDRASLMNELSTTACCVLVSLQEVAPMVIEEAMAAGVPIVASDLCGIPYMVDDGKTGFLVDPKDEKNISEKLYLCINNKEKNINMGKAARQVAITRFHVDVVSLKTLAFYNEILDLPRSNK